MLQLAVRVGLANASRCVFLEITMSLVASFCSTLTETFSKLIPFKV